MTSPSEYNYGSSKIACVRSTIAMEPGSQGEPYVEVPAARPMVPSRTQRGAKCRSQGRVRRSVMALASTTVLEVWTETTLRSSVTPMES